MPPGHSAPGLPGAPFMLYIPYACPLGSCIPAKLKSLGCNDIWVSLMAQTVKSKESACSAGDLGSIPGLGRSLGEGNGNPLNYSCLENSTDRGARRATVFGIPKSWTRLSNTPTMTYIDEKTCQHTHEPLDYEQCP